MATLTAQAITAAGVTPTFVAAAGGGDGVPVSGGQKAFLRVKNGSGSPINVTLLDPGSTPLGVANGGKVVAVPATTGDVLIALNPNVLNAATGNVEWSYSAVTTVTVAVCTL